MVMALDGRAVLAVKEPISWEIDTGQRADEEVVILLRPENSGEPGNL